MQPAIPPAPHLLGFSLPRVPTPGFSARRTWRRLGRRGRAGRRGRRLRLRARSMRRSAAPPPAPPSPPCRSSPPAHSSSLHLLPLLPRSASQPIRSEGREGGTRVKHDEVIVVVGAMRRARASRAWHGLNLPCVVQPWHGLVLPCVVQPWHGLILPCVFQPWHGLMLPCAVQPRRSARHIECLNA